MVAKGTPRQPKSKGNADELAALKERLDQQAQQLADQRQQIIDLQGQLADAQTLPELEADDLDPDDYVDIEALRTKLRRYKRSLDLATETIVYLRESERSARTNPNKCKVDRPVGRRRRRARGLLMATGAMHIGLIPLIDLDGDDEHAVTVIEELAVVADSFELLYEMVHIHDTPPLPDDDSIQVEGEL